MQATPHHPAGEEIRPCTRLRAPAVLLAAATTIVALLAFPTSVPAVSAVFTPTPPPGWHITAVTEPAWTQLFDLSDGVLVASTRPSGIQSPDAVYDAYRLGGGGAPTAALRDVADGMVFDLDRGTMLYGSLRPGADPDAVIRDLFVRDLGSGVITKLPVPPDLLLNPNGSPTIDDGRVAWSQFGFQHEPEIMLYDTAAGATTKLSHGREAQGAPDIDGTDVVWHAWDGERGRILHCDLETGTVRELAGDLPYTAGLAPQVDDGRATWATHEWITPQEDRTSLFLADLSTGTTSLVNATAGAINAVLSGDLLVTATSADAVTFALEVRDLVTGDTHVLTESLRPWHTFSTDGRAVVWEEGWELPGDQGLHTRIRLYESASGEVIDLAESVGIGRPLVDRGRVVFAHRIDSETNKLWLAERDDAPAYDHYLDVLATDPYREAIQEFSSRGFVAGYVTGTFRTFHPRHPLLRAQLAKILATSLGLPVDEGLTPPDPFTDLGSDDPANLYPHEYVAAVAQAGLMRGYSATAFGPWDQLTRAQMVTVTVRAIQSRAPDLLLTPPPGYAGSVAEVPAVHAENLRVAEYNGLLDDLVAFGTGWDPNAYARRGEVVQMLSALPDLID